MDYNKLLFLQEDHRDTYNRFYPYHEEMQRLFGVPVYEERKSVGRFLNSSSIFFGNTLRTNSESDSGISSPCFADTILNSSDSSPDSSGSTSASCSDSSTNSSLEGLLKSFLSPRQNPSSELTRTTFRDSWLKTTSTTTTGSRVKCTRSSSNYTLFGNNGLDLVSQITKTSEKKPQRISIEHKCKCEICNATLTPSVGVPWGGNYGTDLGSYSDVLMKTRQSVPRLRNTNELRRRAPAPEAAPRFTDFAFPTAARVRKEKPKACKFCKKNGELPEVYFGHEAKDANERVTCPILRRYVCELCGATGDKAHTRKYCPKYVGFEERLPLFRRLANGVISISHNHK